MDESGETPVGPICDPGNRESKKNDEENETTAIADPGQWPSGCKVTSDVDTRFWVKTIGRIRCSNGVGDNNSTAGKRFSGAERAGNNPRSAVDKSRIIAAVVNNSTCERTHRRYMCDRG
jgi:hypothetical protein